MRMLPNDGVTVRVEPNRTVLLLVTAEETARIFYKGYVRFLVERGWHVFVGANAKGPALGRQVGSEGGTFIQIPWARDPDLPTDIKNLVRLGRVIRKISPTAVVAATPKAGLLGMLAARLVGVPVRIYQQWGLRLETMTGVRRYLFARLERLTISSSTQCVANSRSLAERIEGLGLADAGSVAVLGSGSSHGVDLEHFASDAEVSVDSSTTAFLESGAHSPILVFVGRVHPDKGIGTLISALKLCRSRGVHIRLLLVGPNEGAELDLSGVAAHLVGPVEDVRGYLRVADALCLPSLREGFPNVVLEAAAMGVPAVVSDATGSRDSVVDGITGVHFPSGDAGALASAVTDIVSDRARRESFGAHARRRAEKEFSQSHVWQLQEANLLEQVSRTGTAGRQRTKKAGRPIFAGLRSAMMAVGRGVDNGKDVR